MGKWKELAMSDPNYDLNQGYRIGVQEAQYLNQKRINELWEQFEAEKLGISEEADTPTFRLYDGTVIDGPEVVIYDSIPPVQAAINATKPVFDLINQTFFKPCK